MATSLADLINKLRTDIPTYTGFADKAEIPNPYSLADNSIQYLENSFGILVGASSRSSKDSPVESYSVSSVRDIGVILARSVYDVSNQCDMITTQVETLMAEAETIRDNFLSLQKFDLFRGGEEIVYIGDLGVNFLETGKQTVVYTQVDFTFEFVNKIN